MKPFRNWVLIVIMIFGVSAAAFAQKTVNKTLYQNPFGKYKSNPITFTMAGIGVMGYFGDLEDGGVNLQSLRSSFSMATNFYVTPNLSFRTQLATGTAYAHDELSQYDTHRARNLHFRNQIIEANGVLVFELFKNPNLQSRYFYQVGSFLSPYVFVGGGVFYHNPQGELNGQWVDLQPLGTEGQFIAGTVGSSGSEVEVADYPEPYSRIQLSIPFGMGVSFFASRLLTVGLEANIRKTFTDYLDDVSTQYPDLGLLAQTPNGSTAVLMSDRIDNSIRDDGGGTNAPRGNPGYGDYFYTVQMTLTYFINWKTAGK